MSVHALTEPAVKLLRTVSISFRTPVYFSLPPPNRLNLSMPFLKRFLNEINCRAVDGWALMWKGDSVISPRVHRIVKLSDTVISPWFTQTHRLFHVIFVIYTCIWLSVTWWFLCIFYFRWIILLWIIKHFFLSWRFPLRMDFLLFKKFYFLKVIYI